MSVFSGPAARSGPAGESAYQIAVRNGYTDTESKWISEVQGAGTSAIAAQAAASETAASTSATKSANFAAGAQVSATAAKTAETNAAGSAKAAQTTADSVSGFAAVAVQKASETETSARDAAISAAAASTSESNAAASAGAAVSAASEFSGRYLGEYETLPTTQTDGAALDVGVLGYQSTVDVGLKVWDGSNWVAMLQGVDGADGTDGAVGPAGADGTDGAVGPAGADGVHAHRNALINGAFQIDQDGLASFGTTETYLIDRWVALGAGATNTFAKDVLDRPSEFLTSVSIDTQSGGWFEQRIEGATSVRFSGYQSVVSFWAKNIDTDGNVTIEIGTADAFDNFGTITSQHTSSIIAVSGSWARYEVTIPVIADTSNGVYVRFNLNAGAIKLTGVQYERGSTATDFEHLEYLVEQKRCLRFLNAVNLPYDLLGGLQGFYHSGPGAFSFTIFIQEMRTTPTVLIPQYSLTHVEIGGGAGTGGSPSANIRAIKNNCIFIDVSNPAFTPSNGDIGLFSGLIIVRAEL